MPKKPKPPEDEESSADTLERFVPAPSPLSFETGYVPDVPDARDYDASARFGAPVDLPAESLGLRAFVRRVTRQVGSSCVGMAIARAIDCRLRRLRFRGPEPSGMAIYAGALQALGEKPYRDEGSRARDAMAFVKEIGVPREEIWPSDDRSLVARELPWHVHQDASRFLLFRWWRISTVGRARSDSIAKALAEEIPVVFGLDLDEKFHAYRSGTIEHLDDTRGGGHMLCILGYRTEADGSRVFLVINSWGEEWGENGYCWIHERVICSSRAGDFYAIEVSP